MNAHFPNNTTQKLRGVNLGGWLVLEKWMTPSLFAGLNAVDETTYCVELGEAAISRLQKHWRTFITRDDFAWLASIGINAVRIPLGHWIFGPDYPYHRSYGAVKHPFVTGGIDILDRAFDWADDYGLRIMLDLHAAPGCQNGFDNGGIQDVCEWHTQPTYIEYALQILERLAQRYQLRSTLHSIQVLNEPRWDIPTSLLQQYTLAAYQRIRQFCTPEQVAVVFHDGFRPFHEYTGFLMPPEFNNVILDLHRYQCFEPKDLDTDLCGHIEKAVVAWKNEADALTQNRGKSSAIVAEWSLGLNVKTLFADSPEDLDDFRLAVAYRAYAAAQLATFEQYLGWFFWSYKTETAPAWCFRTCVERGWLPERFT